MSNLVPEGWSIISLGDMCKFTQGIQISSQNMIREPSSGYIRYMYIRDFLSDDRKWFVEDIHPEKVITESDIAMANTGHTSGTVYKGKLGVLSNNAFKISFPSEEINTDFIFNFLKSGFFLRKIKQLFNTAGQPHVGHGNIAKIPTLLPPLPEQQKIAAILSSVDEVIEKTQAQINKLKDLKTGMMQELLSPREGQAANINITQGESKNGLHHTEFKDSPLGRIPVGWEVLTMRDVCNTRQGLQIPISKRFSENGNGRYVYLTIRFINSGFNPNLAQYIENPKSTVICDIDDIILARTGSTGKVVTGVNGVFHNNFFMVDYDRQLISKDYLVQYLNCTYIQTEISNRAGTTTIPDLNHGDFYSLPIPMPSREEQKIISDILSSVDIVIEKNKLKLSSVNNAKKALMQDLLTGKVRVKVDAA